MPRALIESSRLRSSNSGFPSALGKGALQTLDESSAPSSSSHESPNHSSRVSSYRSDSLGFNLRRDKGRYHAPGFQTGITCAPIGVWYSARYSRSAQIVVDRASAHSELGQATRLDFGSQRDYIQTIEPNP
jgi:hypothetical protein